MYRVTLTRVKVLKDGEVSENPLRTEKVTGLTAQLPTVGLSFVILAPAIKEGSPVRTVQTSEVMSVETFERAIYFKTRNSEYRVDVLAPPNANNTPSRMKS